MNKLTKEQQELHEKNKHISSEIIEIDINDTQEEINEYVKRIEECNNRIIYIQNAIQNRQDFIKKLEAILEIRKRLENGNS